MTLPPFFARPLAWLLLHFSTQTLAAAGGIIGAVVLLGGATLLARCRPEPTREVTTREATSQVDQLAELRKFVERESARDVDTVTTEERRPDGSTSKRTERHERAREATHATTEAATSTEVRTREAERHEVERERARHRLAVLPGWRPRALALAPSEVAIEYTQRVAGPFSAGIWARVEREPRVSIAAGVAIAVEW